MHETALSRLRSGSALCTDTDKWATEAFIDEVKLDLVSYDIAIDELENKFAELKRARNVSSHHLATAQALASPVWKVPVEIWTAIFSSYARENRMANFLAAKLLESYRLVRAPNLVFLEHPQFWSTHPVKTRS
ncbi:hypothetical protein BT96DRAFT_931356 [Gymnopus androsaceus JB14]|uniref:Uncharacterized protein n=1 Tax=Gymnopus androsaceus JB14 TaxID=1447944 RepID=A0A6A4IGV9_9AGAR|nr:hypothetical protein BT96DRAFT_931356 [Gymnopus androsaceus JB14]